MSKILLLPLLLGCTKAVIEGEVVDHEGAPVVAAQVAIKGTTFSALTDTAGHFSVPFAPGMFKLTVAKDGYLRMERPYLITDSVSLPLAPIAVYAVAPGAGATALTPTGAVAVDILSPEVAPSSNTIGLRALPALHVPADVWGFVIPQRSAEVDPLARALARISGPKDSDGVELSRLAWTSSTSMLGWHGTERVPVNLWTAGQPVPATVLTTDETEGAGVVLRPEAILEDGAYALQSKGIKGWAVFIVGQSDPTELQVLGEDGAD